MLVSVLSHYLENKRIVSEEHARAAAKLVLHWLFEVKKVPKAVKVSAFRRDWQEEFVVWSAAEKGHSSATISRNLSVVSAAVKFATKEQAVRDPDGNRRNVQLLSSAPQIRFEPRWIVETARENNLAVDMPRRADWVPTYEEVASFIDAIRAEHVFRFVILALNTWARRETIEELDLSKQVSLRNGLVDLNEPGRLQTHKRRPIIRLTDNLRAWMPAWEEADKALAKSLREEGRPVEFKAGRPLIYRGQGAGVIKKAMQRTNARWMLAEAGTDEKEIRRLTRKENNKELTAAVNQLVEAGGHRITSRTFRSFMATRVRMVPGIRVDREQRQLWLGHLQQDTTAHYEIVDSEYLREAAAATDAIIREIDRHCERSLWPETAS
ncbi:hypothetical protein DYI37_04105 [Fulvimarina endophytica]|uniref:Tyr recombinase domain-containing protein n=1 Tax=Fulvimarina endophytica TaxID=2293836 RepID=A0A371X773_9HYPH|nr:hypothetical protein [Fulvimarina endophytica]RFC65057.1 hypothetical protein DYI37_04105 [Fulvimarina endophytica]